VIDPDDAVTGGVVDPQRVRLFKCHIVARRLQIRPALVGGGAKTRRDGEVVLARSFDAVGDIGDDLGDAAFGDTGTPGKRLLVLTGKGRNRCVGRRFLIHMIIDHIAVGERLDAVDHLGFVAFGGETLGH